MRANQKNFDPEDALARLSQEATNQSTPDKAVESAKERRTARRKIARKRVRPPKP